MMTAPDAEKTLAATPRRVEETDIFRLSPIGTVRKTTSFPHNRSTLLSIRTPAANGMTTGKRKSAIKKMPISPVASVRRVRKTESNRKNSCASKWNPPANAIKTAKDIKKLYTINRLILFEKTSRTAIRRVFIILHPHKKVYILLSQSLPDLPYLLYCKLFNNPIRRFNRYDIPFAF
jgi:hypothetical protein